MQHQHNNKMTYNTGHNNHHQYHRVLIGKQPSSASITALNQRTGGNNLYQNHDLRQHSQHQHEQHCDSGLIGDSPNTNQANNANLGERRNGHSNLDNQHQHHQGQYQQYHLPSSSHRYHHRDNHLDNFNLNDPQKANYLRHQQVNSSSSDQYHNYQRYEAPNQNHLIYSNQQGSQQSATLASCCSSQDDQKTTASNPTRYVQLPIKATTRHKLASNGSQYPTLQPASRVIQPAPHSSAPKTNSDVTTQQQQQQQQKQQQQQQQPRQGSHHRNSREDNGVKSFDDSEKSTDQNRHHHVNFNNHSSQIAEGEESSERKKKYLTAKYGQHQMSLIKKRLRIEMWLFERLQELANNETAPDDIDIDLDYLLDLEDASERKYWLKTKLQPLEEQQSRQVLDEFIDDILEQAKLL